MIFISSLCILCSQTYFPFASLELRMKEHKTILRVARGDSRDHFSLLDYIVQYSSVKLLLCKKAMQEFIYLMLLCCTEIRQVQQTLLSVFIVHFGSQLKCLLQNKLPKSSRFMPLLCQYNLSKLVHVLKFLRLQASPGAQNCDQSTLMPSSEIKDENEGN